ncbi:MAG: hypothetical protein C5B58_01110 [Acidobacteria bacterium]|nr:MAG: hypothetical protein C5B58_01110 [Acidobacteriota bacterium]
MKHQEERGVESRISSLMATNFDEAAPDRLREKAQVDLEKRLRARHQLRLIRHIVNEVLLAPDGEFAKIYGDSGGSSIPPNGCSALLCFRAFYRIRSETQLMEQLRYNLRYRWFFGLGIDEPVWVPTLFTDRERLLEAEVAHKLLAELLNHRCAAYYRTNTSPSMVRRFRLGVDEELPRQDPTIKKL